jgi:hypothetical protein
MHPDGLDDLRILALLKKLIDGGPERLQFFHA